MNSSSKTITVFCLIIIIFILIINRPIAKPKPKPKKKIIANPIEYLEKKKYKKNPLENIITDKPLSREVKPLFKTYDSGEFYDKKTSKGKILDVDEFMHKELRIK